MKKILIYLMVLVLSIAAISAFSLTGFAEKTRRYVHVVLISTHPFWTEIKQGAQDAADQRGVIYEFTGPVEFDAVAQADQIRALVVTKPDGLIIGAYDPSMTEVINYAMDAGIPVVTCNGDAPYSKRLSFIGEDFYKQGLTMYGPKMADLLGGKGKVGILTVLAQASSLGERIRGIKDYFAANAPDIEIVAIEENQGDDQITADKTKTLILAHPELDGIFVVNATGSGVATALRETGKVGEIKVVVSDVSAPIMEGILEGAIDTTFVANIYFEGYFALSILDDYVTGKFDNHPWKEAGAPLTPAFVAAGGYWASKEFAETYLATLE